MTMTINFDNPMIIRAGIAAAVQKINRFYGIRENVFLVLGQDGSASIQDMDHRTLAEFDDIGELFLFLDSELVRSNPSFEDGV